MKEGQTVFIITRAQNIVDGVLGEESTAQGFYTRWGVGHHVYFTFRSTTTIHNFSDENIFSTKEDAKKELFIRRLRYPQFYGARA